jgi:hypothetical protein
VASLILFTVFGVCLIIKNSDKKIKNEINTGERLKDVIYFSVKKNYISCILKIKHIY